MTKLILSRTSYGKIDKHSLSMESWTTYFAIIIEQIVPEFGTFYLL